MLARTIATLARSLAAVLLALAVGLTPATAEGLRTFTKKAAFDDVKFELSNAITAKGLKIDYTGHIGKMLERTGADVGSTKAISKSAEFYTFCSAKLSRDMMEASAANIGYCPYVIFIYETAAKPGVVHVGYRRPPSGGRGATKKALAAIDKLLEEIAKEAVK